MKKLLILGLFPVFLLSFVSKWYVDLGFRIPYYLLIAAPWCALALPGIFRRKIIVPAGLQLLIFLKCAYLAAIALSFLVLFDGPDPAARQQFTKGFVMAGVDTLIITTILLYLTKLAHPERARVLRLYLGAVACHMVFMVAEAVGMYLFEIDIDILISERIPFWSQSVVTMAQDRFYLVAIGTIYRLSGLTGDPNIAGVSLALALPVISYCYTLKPRVSFVVLALSTLLLIMSTVSNTAIPIAGMLLLALSTRYWRRQKLLVAGIAVPLAIAAIWVIKKQAEALDELVAFKLAGDGTAYTHLTIAKDAMNLWFQHPMGLGLNNFALHSEHISSHNSYVQTVVELGVIGLTATLAWICAGLWLSYQSANAIGTAAMLTLASLAIASNGHDLLFRFEFQLIANVLVAMAIMERWQEPKTRLPSNFGGR
jgi:O-antigen ligase